ncbi:unnamed protein product [Pleuronectes platessa]|uniref:Uncharacterized protein n=1 Tax=Pleuronectes platessa TaxID=8262 RepID=A0A9N7YYE5_PLEPL|nr:unnamed protein product [Pleuronectes platessa]
MAASEPVPSPAHDLAQLVPLPLAEQQVERFSGENGATWDIDIDAQSSFKYTVSVDSIKVSGVWGRADGQCPPLFLRYTVCKRVPIAHSDVKHQESERVQLPGAPAQKKPGNQLSPHDLIRNIPWTVEEHQTLSHPILCPNYLFTPIYEVVRYNLSLQLLLNKLQNMRDENSTQLLDFCRRGLEKN